MKIRFLIFLNFLFLVWISITRCWSEFSPCYLELVAGNCKEHGNSNGKHFDSLETNLLHKKNPCIYSLLNWAKHMNGISSYLMHFHAKSPTDKVKKIRLRMEWYAFDRNFKNTIWRKESKGEGKWKRQRDARLSPKPGGIIPKLLACSTSPSNDKSP